MNLSIEDCNDDTYPMDCKIAMDAVMALVKNGNHKESTLLALIATYGYDVRTSMMLAHRVGMLIGNNIGLQGQPIQFV